MNECCFEGFLWDGTPTGREDTFANQKTYIAGDNQKRAILLVHDALGWSFKNTRILADHYAKEVGATVYLPDFFEGWPVNEKDISIEIKDGKASIARNEDFDWAKWFTVNGPARYPEVLAFAKKLREHGYEFVGAVGFCWGGSAGFKLASKDNKGLLDCITIAHPGPPDEEDVKNLGIPVQIIAPQWDPTFSQESKDMCNRIIPTLGIEYVYNYFPGMVHGFCTKVDSGKEVERRALEKAKRAVVWWFLTHAAK